ncbi:NADPH-dependent assimilatory sulfite reductase hemoprotein subunit [Paenibacillus filicis]|uniref:NADPH-dependent assimilatory sulfite reductase hemoprotein subunit n=1 Tax=Paenibacillus gyeongsangnamensis TaxID=3388067 RepID=A0ABT4Q864_9BACL|nr:NADPH-dependent assimilatory sulfite reductase hemoprotein subunit [Paenibacillus filicis]MCZ8513062.1 NADPH-dependent assimilatory sulfite reductase hemoprotein subunit [Paenibacillus filicis]
MAASNEENISKIEIIKRQSRQLRGTIKEALSDEQNKFSEDNVQVLKFHGVYQQDDRDLRAQLTKEGKDRHYSMMIRARIPGGVLSPDQYLTFDRLADEYSDYKNIRITTRQTLQLHGILKGDLKTTIKTLNEALVTTLGACGDSGRNTICCAEPGDEPFRAEMQHDVLALADRLSAKTNAYHEIWIDGEAVQLADDKSEEPLYGEVYLPRKFKVAIVPEGDNCLDVYDNDLGLVAHIESGHIRGYTVLVGGGMGRMALDQDTYPRLASPLCYVARDEAIELILDTCVAIVTIERDYGDRSNRRFARMKYLIDRRGLEWFREEVETRLGRKLEPPRPLKWHNGHDHLGWHRERDGISYLGIFIPYGRIKDTETMQLKSVLRDIVHDFRPIVRFTSQQNVILSGIANELRPAIEERLRAAGVPLPEELSNVRQNTMACVSLPTCGLALAESERALPELMPQFEQLFDELGLSNEEITIRMTGCSNGCARPYNANIAFIGRSPGKYDMFLGGSSLGTALNTRFRETVPFDQLVPTVRSVLESFVQERETGEEFGMYWRRTGLEKHRDYGTDPNPA